jgi:hypothetical protein
MRPIRVTGITGNSPPVPLDVYATGATTQVSLSGAGVLQQTIDNVFDLSLTINWVAPTAAAANGLYSIPAGIRAVRATGMAPADVLVVSQQGLQ